MKILVCISNVPDTTTKITFTDNNTQFNTNGVQFILNPYDEIALSRAIELTEGGKGSITVINVGEASTEATIRKALAIGADDAVRINAKPHDAWFVAYQIAQYVKANTFDLILTGRESIDYNGSKVAGMLGELLDLPSVSIIKKLDVDGNNGTVKSLTVDSSASNIVSNGNGTVGPLVVTNGLTLNGGGLSRPRLISTGHP